MKIAVDAMGGDYAPEAIVEGAIQAADEYRVSIVLVGQEDVVKQELEKHDTALLSIEVRHASQIVDMHDEPAVALRRKRDSSLHGAINLVRDGYADAAVSVGNTGAGMAVGVLACRTLEGIARPGLATVMPNINGATVVIDVGANVDCKPIHLLQFAVMGHVYAKEVLKIDNPRIGLLSTGEEATKGNALTKEVYETLSQANLNFIGNAEGRDVFNGRVDVVVCDGFVGNVVLKASESLAKSMLFPLLKEGFSKNWRTKLGYLLAKPGLEILKKRTDHSEYGGAPLLGLNGVVIIGHGSSKAHALKNAIRVARESVELRLPERIAETLQECAFDVKSRKRAKSFWRQLRNSIRHDRDKEKSSDDKQEKPEVQEQPEQQEQQGQPEQPEFQAGDQIHETLSETETLPDSGEHEKRPWWHRRDSKHREAQTIEAQEEPKEEPEFQEPLHDETHEEIEGEDSRTTAEEFQQPEPKRRFWRNFMRREPDISENQEESNNQAHGSDSFEEAEQPEDGLEQKDSQD